MEEVRAGRLPFSRLDVLHRRNLEIILPRFGIEGLPEEILGSLTLAWHVLHASYPTKRINHSVCYSDGDACTNWAESYFSRLRRAGIGIHHHIAGPYLGQYADEMAWREDHRRESNGQQYLRLVSAAAKHPVSRNWKGCWQRQAKVAAE